MRTWKAWIVVALIFLSGIGLGVVGTQYQFYRMHTKMDADLKAGVPPFFHKLANHLGLTDEQKEKAEAIFIQAHPRFIEVMNQCKPAMDDVFEETVEQLKKNLSPAQQEELDRIMVEIRLLKSPNPGELEKQIFGDEK